MCDLAEEESSGYLQWREPVTASTEALTFDVHSWASRKFPT
jgi:hypothetical protein